MKYLFSGKLFFSVILVFLVVQAGVGAADNVFTRNGYALAGYDVVAYHTQQMPVKGDEKFSHVWNSANWIFSSLENRDAFAANPEKYAPAYGGYCAYAMSKGSLAPSDINAWTLDNGRLYLNFSPSVQKIWQADRGKYIKRANFHWRNMN